MLLSGTCLCAFVASGVTLDSVYKSLNRTVLYLLSRPIRSVTGQMALLDALHRLTSHRSLILGPGNFDQEFIGCLCYCLIQLTANSPENIRLVPLSPDSYQCLYMPVRNLLRRVMHVLFSLVR